MKPEKYRFDRTGLLAIDPAALGDNFLSAGDIPRAPVMVADGRAAMVKIMGPLCYDGWLFQGYAGVKQRVAEALATSADCIILWFNSPGGEVFGAFDCARDIRAMAQAAGKKIIAFTEAQIASAAYAIACAADEIVCADTACVGSIGVIAAIIDATAQAEAAGIRFAVVTSGERKADGNPMAGLSDGAVEALQQRVDETAAVFFDLVKSRRGIDPQPLQAAQFVGAKAKDAGLVDRIESWEQLLASLASDDSRVRLTVQADTAAEISSMADEDKDKKPPEDSTRAGLVTAAESDDPKKAARAKRALAAYDEEEASAEDEGDKPDAAAVSDEPKKDEEKKDEAVAASSPAAIAAAVSAELKRVALEDAKQAAAVKERADLIASRPDLSAEFFGKMSALSTSQLRDVIAAMPGPKGKAPEVAKSATPLRGENQGSDVQALTPNPALDARMNLIAQERVVQVKGNVQTFGALVPKGSV